jgi:hypothetical protein
MLLATVFSPVFPRPISTNGERPMRVKSLVGIGCLALLMAGCGSSKYKDALVGKWQNPSNPAMVFEFTASGRLNAGHMTGNYTLDAWDTVWITTDKPVSMPGGKVTSKFKSTVSISGDTLVLTDPDGSKATFKRMK